MLGIVIFLLLSGVGLFIIFYVIPQIRATNSLTRGFKSPRRQEAAFRLQSPTTRGYGFHRFIQNVIRLFQHQRIEGYQFAVLFLTSHRDITTMVFRTATREVNSPDMSTDNSCLTFPPDHNVCNYVTARPKGHGGQGHAEEQLMEKFDMLLRRYQSLGKPACQTIVLYTWLLPCANCANIITRKLGWGRQQPRVVLVYTSKMQDVTDQDSRRIVSDMESAGITVIQEKYDSYMAPA